jgi:hypothetical protein
MNRGRVYLWTPERSGSLGGAVTAEVVLLPRLEAGGKSGVRLRGRFVVVRNGGAVNEPDPLGAGVRATRLGDAEPDAAGDFLFAPGRGGGRIDKVAVAEPDFRGRYIQAARFGEVNTYFHVDRIAAYVDGLLQKLGAVSLPRVIAVVTAHPAATEEAGVRDGVLKPSGRWYPFQGGHYRLPARQHSIAEREPLSPDGEIHLGPGWKLLEHGALVEAVGGRYRANASHNASIIYHEYSHHIARHTADFTANALRRPDRQRNRKHAIEEGTCDYWVATLLETPHIWAWHRPYDVSSTVPHPRSLTSAQTMRDYDARPGADPHANGTIWAAALWELRSRLGATEGALITDLLVLKALLLLGRLPPPLAPSGRAALQRVRSSFAAGLAALLHADDLLSAGRHQGTVLSVFAAHGILPDRAVRRALEEGSPVGIDPSVAAREPGAVSARTRR